MPICSDPTIIMSLLDALRTVKLKKTEVGHDASAPTFSHTIEGTTHAYNSTVLNCNIEQWAELLGDYTFKTVMLPITPKHAKLLFDGYKAYEEAGKNVGVVGVFVERLEAELGEGLRRLMKGLDPQQQGVFMKMSSRSAKDAGAKSGTLKQLYKRYLSSYDVKDENTKIISLLAAGRQLMRYRNSREALEMFVISERIYQDMLLALKYPERWNESIVIREWVEIDVDMEFRGFVSKGSLNAVCQYNYNIFSARLVEKKDDIATLLRVFYEEKIRPLISDVYTDCVVDFTVTSDGKVYVIEINPFLSTTDGALFSWEKERKVLKEGPFEMRVTEKPRPGASVQFAKDWKAILESE